MFYKSWDKEHSKESVCVLADFLVPLLSVSTLHTPNYAQKLYKPYTKLYIPLIINAFLCVWFARKLYTNYTQNPTLRVKETKSQRDKETKDERRKDRLFETLILYFLRKIFLRGFLFEKYKTWRGIAKARNLIVEISFWEMISSLKFPPWISIWKI